MRQRWKYLQLSIDCGDGANIVRQQTISPAIKLGRERGFADTLRSHKDHCTPSRLDRASMQGEQSSLIEKRADDRPQQE
jgi:hypothetical protein